MDAEAVEETVQRQKCQNSESGKKENFADAVTPGLEEGDGQENEGSQLQNANKAEDIEASVQANGDAEGVALDQR